MEKVIEELSLVLNKSNEEYAIEAKKLVMQLKEIVARSMTKCFPTYVLDADREILGHIDNKYLLPILLTCKQLYHLMSDELLWKMRIRLKYGIQLDEYIVTYNKSYKYYHMKLIKTYKAGDVLHLAANEGLTNIFIELDIESQISNDGYNPRAHLLAAINNNHFDIVDYILKEHKGRIFNFGKADLLSCDSKIFSRLIESKDFVFKDDYMLHASIDECLTKGTNLDNVRLLLGSGIVPNFRYYINSDLQEEASDIIVQHLNSVCVPVEVFINFLHPTKIINVFFTPSRIV